VAEALRAENPASEGKELGFESSEFAKTTIDHRPPTAGVGGEGGSQSSVVGGRWSVVYVGSPDGMEVDLVTRESDLPLRTIPAAAIRGRAPWTIARNLVTVAKGTRAAQRLIAEEQPAAILGTGGYVCVPLFLAARAAGVPTIIYLPDVVPGLAIRALAQLATTVACNVEDSKPYFNFGIKYCKLGARQSELQNLQSKIVITGYPVRPELFYLNKQECRAAFELDDSLPVLLITGGSRGARSINKAIAALLMHLLPLTQIIHVCGREGDEQFLREAAARLSGELQARYRVYPYLFSGVGESGGKGVGSSTANSPTPPPPYAPTMTRAYGAADLAVCRSGASTLAEAPAAQLPVVLVPYPYVHQEENADYLVRHGAAVKVRDAEMLGNGRPEDGSLFLTIQRLLRHEEERTRMSECSHRLARPDAAHHLAHLLLASADRRSLT
jgi:UDP-N-acetylglucosamine--N-acetylmuramyl-(pentapeptide) pyrophosphoryl-undecaprenol N-acetylglucosamine transferase